MSTEQKITKNNFSQKFPLILTILFFAIVVYLSFNHHPYWFNEDGILYFWWGEQILQGDGSNVDIFNHPPGASIVHAGLNNFVKDAFVSKINFYF